MASALRRGIDGRPVQPIGKHEFLASNLPASLQGHTVLHNLMHGRRDRKHVDRHGLLGRAVVDEPEAGIDLRGAGHIGVGRDEAKASTRMRCHRLSRAEAHSLRKSLQHLDGQDLATGGYNR